MIPPLTNDQANRLLDQAGAMTTESDREFVTALEALLKAAPGCCLDAVLEFEAAANAHAVDLLCAGFALGRAVMQKPPDAALRSWN